jgi:hypothetical protein
MTLGHPDVGPIPRLTISINAFGANSTLASFVQWTSLFFDGPLTLKHFQDVSVVKEENPGKDECDNANWRLKYHCYEIGIDEDIVFRMFSVILWVFTKPWLEKSLQLFALYILEPGTMCSNRCPIWSPPWQLSSLGHCRQSAAREA